MLRRLFARRVPKPPPPVNPPQDPELMAIVQKHVDSLLAQGLSSDTIIRQSFGEEVLRKLPTDPTKAAAGQVNLADLNLNIDPKLLLELKALTEKRSKEAKTDSEAQVKHSVAPVQLPSAYKLSDIDKRLQKLRSKQPK